MNLTEKHVCKIVNSPVFKEEMKKLSDGFRARVLDNSCKVREIFNLAAPNAAKKLVKIMDEAPEVRDQRRAAKDIDEFSNSGADRDERKQPMIISQQQAVLIDKGLEEED